jgi:nucleoside-diphosphate-sugar epimerase
MRDGLVLVTGGSGFIAARCIVTLLGLDYRVRTTVRRLSRVDAVRTMLNRAGVEPGDRLEFVAADLTSDAGWERAVDGCENVLHVASPFPLELPSDENELIVPARDGALRVLRAARDAGVKRVVLTSSFAAVGWGGQEPGHVYTESDWTAPELPGVGAYERSKTLAEQAAWEFVNTEGGGMELAVVNPFGVLGPVLDGHRSTSVELVRRLLNGFVPGVPRVAFGLVDVRDVADLHLRAMTDRRAAGERFLAVSGEPLSVRDVALVLRSRLGAAARRVPTRVLPDLVFRIAAPFNASVRRLLPELGRAPRVSNAKAREQLGWTPRSSEEAIVATARSLIELGVVDGALSRRRLWPTASRTALLTRR